MNADSGVRRSARITPARTTAQASSLISTQTKRKRPNHASPHREEEPDSSEQCNGTRTQGESVTKRNKGAASCDKRVAKSSAPQPLASHEDSTESDISEDLNATVEEESDDNDATSDLNDSDLEDALDVYFTAHNKRTVHTSNRTMGGIVLTSKDRTDKSIQSISQKLIKCQQALNARYCKLYPQWLFQMAQGFNVLLYGVGSKISIVEDFVQKRLSQSLCFTIDGYFPGLTVRHALKAIVRDALGYEKAIRTETDQVSFVKEHLAKRSTAESPCELFLIIHNVDGFMLQNVKAQHIFASLAACKNIHVLATVDHINSPLLWDQTRCTQFNWVYHNVTTFAAYTAETSYENSMLAKQSDALVLCSLLHVLRSLTPNSRGIFNLLAKYHMSHHDKQGYTGLSFQDLYSKCREQFLVNSDITLRVQLTEFHDHKLVKSHKGTNGLEYLVIPIDKSTLKQYFATLD